VSAIPQFSCRLAQAIGGAIQSGGRIDLPWYNRRMPQSKPMNPFYVASLPVGIVFAITACAYVVMTIRGSDARQAEATGLIALMEQHGLAILIGEIVILGLLTFAAIASDDFWTRRFESKRH
jgi:hypothetical protein